VLQVLSTAQGFLFLRRKEKTMQTAEEITETKLELKYCEGCGALQLRAVESERVYCVHCWKVLREMAGRRRRDRRPA
jgi:hypothetical protein